MLTRLGPAAEDADLVQALAAADVDALALCYERYGEIAYAVALRVLGDAGIAEDVVQESFLKLWNSASRFDPARGSVRAWLLTMVRNSAIDRMRGRGAHERRELELINAELVPAGGNAADPSLQVSLSVERDAVKDALSRLPPEQRQAIELAYFGGYTQAEIAGLTNVPLSTVKGRMRLALEKLHSYLEGRGLMDER